MSSLRDLTERIWSYSVTPAVNEDTIRQHLIDVQPAKEFVFVDNPL